MKKILLFVSISIGIVIFSGCEKKDDIYLTNCGDSKKTDVSNFKIMDKGLGEKYTDSIKQNIQFFKNNIQKTLGHSNNSHVLYGEEKNLGNGLTLYLDTNQNIYSINKLKEYTVKPDFEHIKKQLYQKFGNPDMVGYLVSPYGNGVNEIIRTFCWGACYQFKKDHKENSSIEVGVAKCGQSLIVRYVTQDYSSTIFPDSNTYTINFKLIDSTILEKMKKMEQDIKNDKEEKIRKIESNLNI